MHKLAVFGNPIAHSLSPQIHQQFAAQFDLAISYEKILAPLTEFKKTVADFFAQTQALGCNVTVPFKIEAFEWVDALSDRAKLAGAVNTIKRQDGKFFGDNTDGVGLLNDLQAKNIALKNQQIIIVGAGGAARGILPVLLSQQPACVVIVNRDLAKAQSLLSEKVVATSYEALPEYLADTALLIDSTSNFDAVKQALATLHLPKSLALYDLKYGREAPTPLIQWAAQQGLAAYDGLGMLIEQAAEAFYLWFNQRPMTQKIYLRAH